MNFPELLLLIIVLLLGISMFTSGGEAMLDAAQTNSLLYLIVGGFIMYVGYQLLSASAQKAIDT